MPDHHQGLARVRGDPAVELHSARVDRRLPERNILIRDRLTRVRGGAVAAPERGVGIALRGQGTLKNACCVRLRRGHQNQPQREK